MKKTLALIFALINILVACSKSDTDGDIAGTGSGGGPANDKETASIKLSMSSITLGGSIFDTAEVSVSTNMTVITPVCNETWMTARMMGRILIITASEHNETGTPRNGTITVTAGEGTNTAVATLDVIQNLRDASTETPEIQLTSQPEDLDAASGSQTHVTFSTNQTEVSVSFAEPQDWLSYEIEDGRINFTALSANSTGLIRTADVTIYAGVAAAQCVIRQNPEIPEGFTIGALYEGGMIFEITADHIKVVSLREGRCSWATDSVKELLIGTDDGLSDGLSNTLLISSYQNFSGNFPAAEWCLSLGDGWYMPSIQEIGKISSNLNLASPDGQNFIQYLLSIFEGDPFTFENEYYWSCCESGGSKAHCVRLRDGAVGQYSKLNNKGRPVRAVKKIAVDIAETLDKIDGSLADFTITEETWTNN